jgi:hypothetical protein
MAMARDNVQGYIEALAKCSLPIPEEHPQLLTIGVAA